MLLSNNHLFNNSDASGNPVTQQVQSVAVTDASGNPVTGMDLISQSFDTFIQDTFLKYVFLHELNRNLNRAGSLNV